MNLLRPVALVLLLCTFFSTSNALATTYIGYELGEMTLNKFKRFAGEIGYQFDNHATLRLVYLDVVLSEKHLASNFAGAVDGGNVEGLLRGVEIYYDYPVTKNIFIGASTGKFNLKYNHTTLDESVESQSNTLGFALSYVGDVSSNFEQLYWRFSGTFRYYFDPIEETMLGESIVNDGQYAIVPWIFIGIRF